MESEAMSVFSAWESFYVIVGSSAGALTGLQFVVIALIADSRAARSRPEVDAFGTPTVVHFCAALLVSATLSAPWHTISPPGLLLAASGAAGIVYTGIVVRRARRQTGYQPVFEDWLWHAGLPLVAYVTIAGAGFAAARATTPALFAVAAATLLFLFIGIHNAWDTVTYIAVSERRGPPDT
jgi:hypothetical protein